MLNSSYALWMAGSALVAAAIHFFLTKGLKKRELLTGLTLLLGVLLGVVCAKVLYCLTQIRYFRDDVMNDGLWKALFSGNMGKMSFYGGVAGVILAAALAARCTGNGVMDALDAYAPAGALMAALARFGERFLEMIDVGEQLLSSEEGGWFLPLTVRTSYEYSYEYAWGTVTETYTVWNLAVFMLAGIACLIVFAAALLLFWEKRFVRTLFYLCLPQILLESLRSDTSMKFHEFVKVEQLLCMIVMVVILALYGFWAGKKKFTHFLPVVLSLACAGLFVAVEFAKDDKIFAGLSQAKAIPYAVMRAGLVVLALLEFWGFSMLKPAGEGVSLKE